MKSKELVLLIGLVVFDLITKLTANYYLPFKEDVYILNDSISLYLTYNQGAIGGQGNYLLRGENNKSIAVILSCVMGFNLLLYFLWIRRKRTRTIYKVLMGVGLYFTLAILIELFHPLLERFIISSWVASVIGKVTGVIIYGSLFYLSKDKWIRLFALIILAGGVGNLLSHFYSPYRVIDFINVNGTYELLRIGVFNFADLGVNIGMVGLIISTVVWIFKNMMVKPKAIPEEQLNQ